MPALDHCHDIVVRALEKDGWDVDSKPFSLRLVNQKTSLYVDIRASRGQETIILVEVKCFTNDLLAEIYTAIGQYQFYRMVIEQRQLLYPIYLAVPSDAYYGIFRSVLPLAEQINMKLIIVDLANETVEQWIP